MGIGLTPVRSSIRNVLRRAVRWGDGYGWGDIVRGIVRSDVRANGGQRRVEAWILEVHAIKGIRDGEMLVRSDLNDSVHEHLYCY